MINKIAKIYQILQVIQKGELKNYNTNLPIELMILKKIKNGYLIKLGQNTIEAKSTESIQIGAKYWAYMKENNGEITLSNLSKQPKIMDFLPKTELVLEKVDEKNILEFISKMKESIFEALINAKDRDEFLLLSTMLWGMKKNIISIVINQKNSKRAIVQIRFKNKIEFSTIFPNLGIIEGILQGNYLLLNVQYEGVKKLLQKHANKLEGFFLEISLSPKIEIMQDIFENYFLDLEA